MRADYQLWLCDDLGRRLAPFFIDKPAYFSYTRTTHGYGTIQVGVPLRSISDKVKTLFQPDWRIDVWRKPSIEALARRESSYLLRKFRIYLREEDGMEMIEYFGRSPIDLLGRFVSSDAVLSEVNGGIDAVMRGAVNNNYTQMFDTNWLTLSGYPSAFSVDMNNNRITTIVPVVFDSIWGKNILDVLRDWQNVSIFQNKADATYQKIYFDVLEVDTLDGRFDYVFRTFSGIRGSDRTNGVVFSVENGNLKGPSYVEDHLDTATSVMSKDSTGTITITTSPDAELSIFNKSTIFMVEQSTDAFIRLSHTQEKLGSKTAKKDFSCTFINSPGSLTQPRSLYGVDWDMGDILPVQFAGKTFDAEVVIVYVAVDETGKETVTGRTEVGS